MKFAIFSLFFLLSASLVLCTPENWKIKITGFTQKLQTNGAVVDATTNLSYIPGYCVGCPTYFLTHGFNQGTDWSWFADMVSALFANNENINVFTIDWSLGAGKAHYEKAVRNMNSTFRQAGAVIQVWTENGYLTVTDNYINIHIIGHSLGGQVVGLIGKYLYAMMGLKALRITGLDPAGPCFLQVSSENRLSQDDAYFVDVIHSGFRFGLMGQLGHADFYPNGGGYQPGCFFANDTHSESENINKLQTDISCASALPDYNIRGLNPSQKRSIGAAIGSAIDSSLDKTNMANTVNKVVVETESLKNNSNYYANGNLAILGGACDHARALYLYIYSINSECSFVGTKCYNWVPYKNHQCSDCEQNRMGFYSTKPVEPTSYYLYTAPESPHCNLDDPTTLNEYSNPFNGQCTNEIIGDDVGELAKISKIIKTFIISYIYSLFDF